MSVCAIVGLELDLRSFPEPRRAAVAIVIRVVPSSTAASIPNDATIPTLSQFFELDWVKDPGARAEVLFLRREGASPSDGHPGPASALRSTLAGESSTKGKSKAEAQVAFPGGRMEEGDEGGLYTGTSHCILAILAAPLSK